MTYRVMFAGLGGLLVAAAVLGAPWLLAARLDPAVAEDEIRALFARQLGQRHMDELRAAGGRVPDRATAERWQRERAALAGLAFERVDVRTRLLVPPLRKRTAFVARATVAGTGDRRYFCFDAPAGSGRLRECSAAAWHLPF